MRTQHTFRYPYWSLLLLAGIGMLYTSCSKDVVAPKPTVITGGSTGGTTSDLRDTLADIASVYYLWNSNIPKTFTPHSYSATDTLFSEAEAIKTFSPLNAATGNHYDHFSFILTEADYQKEFVQGVSTSFGLGFSFDRNDTLRINYAAHASAAYSQGVRRGWKILSINGIKIATDAATLNSLNNALNASSATFAFQKPASDPMPNQNINITLTKQDIPDDEVITTKVFQEGAKTVGYVAYNTFLTALDPKTGAPIHKGMDASFATLQAAGITDIVIDLRYNGGGYTQVAEQMDNALLPASVNHQVLYKEHYNDTLNKYYNAGYKNVDHDTTISINETNVANPPKLTVNSIVFIVSQNTASAAELIINNLIPYFNGNVKLVGLGKGRRPTEQNTAGKPFGYAGEFAMPQAKPIYEAFLINFETKNSLSQDNYVSGFVPDVQVVDGVEYDFGNPNEDGLSKALSYEATNSLSYNRPSNQLALSSRAGSAGSAGLLMNGSIQNHRFNGMIKRSAITSARKKSLDYQQVSGGKIKPVNALKH